MTTPEHDVRRPAGWHPSPLARIVLGVATATVVASVAGSALVTDASSVSPPGAGFPPSENAEALRADLIESLTHAGRPDLIPAAGSTFTVTKAAGESGVWVFASYRNSAGEQCMMHSIPGEGRGLGCQDRRALFTDGPLFVAPGSLQRPGSSRAGWDVAWVFGFADPSIIAVQLVRTDCSVRRLDLGSDGSFFAVASEASMRGGAWPYAVRGLGVSGKLMDQRTVDFELPNGLGVMIDAPAAQAACRVAGS